MSRNTGSTIVRLRPQLILAAALLVTACASESDAPGADPSTDDGFDTTHAAEVADASGASMGTVVLAPTCGEATDAALRRGLALLHNMTYAEARATFRGATQAEPECGLAYWGVAMTYVHPLWPDVPSDEELSRGRALLEEARTTELSAREAAYVSALEAYYRDGPDRDERARLATYADAWAQVRADHPDDPEAALFTALAMIATAPPSDPTLERQVEAGAIAERVLESVPDHPGAHHYIIHAFDAPPLAERALPVARSYGEVAPENSHVLHVTSHIFTRRGLWEESIDFNRRAADAAWNAPIDGMISFHYLHAVDYLVYAHLQRGADDEAAGIVDRMMNLPDPVVDHAVSAYAYAAGPARMALERRRWEDAAALQPRQPATVAWDRYPHLEAITHFARALGAAHTGDLDAARSAAERVAELKLEAAELPGSYDWATQVEVQELGARAWIAFAEGRTDDAVGLMTRAADLEATTQKNPVTPGEVLPAAELLGDMLMELGRHEEALAAYQRALERSRNRFNSLYGAGLAAERMGDADRAAGYYRLLVDVTAPSTPRSDVLERAEGFLTEA